MRFAWTRTDRLDSIGIAAKSLPDQVRPGIPSNFKAQEFSSRPATNLAGLPSITQFHERYRRDLGIAGPLWSITSFSIIEARLRIPNFGLEPIHQGSGIYG